MRFPGESGSSICAVVDGVVALVVALVPEGVPLNDSTTPVLSPQQLRTYRAEGAVNSVVVITNKEITRLVPSPRSNESAVNGDASFTASPRGEYTPSAKPPVHERCLAIRIDERRLSGQVLTTYGAQG